MAADAGLSAAANGSSCWADADSHEGPLSGGLSLANGKASTHLAPQGGS